MVSTIKGITVGVVLSLFGSDVMNGRQAVTVAASIRSQTISAWGYFQDELMKILQIIIMLV